MRRSSYGNVRQGCGSVVIKHLRGAKKLDGIAPRRHILELAKMTVSLILSGELRNADGCVRRLKLALTGLFPSHFLLDVYHVRNSLF